MAKYFVGGGVGFIGTNLCFEAVNQGHEIVAFDNLSRKGVVDNLKLLEGSLKDKFTFIHGDCRNTDDFKKIPNDIDGIVWLCANPGIPWSIESPEYDFDVNAKGTLNMLLFAKERGRLPLIYASTNKTYSDEINQLPRKVLKTRYIWKKLETIIETNQIDSWLAHSLGTSMQGVSEKCPTDSVGLYPHSPYGVSKLAGDLYCQEFYHVYGVPTVINRMSCIYGLYQKGVEDQGWVSHFIETIINGDGNLNIYGDGKQVRDMLFGSDVAKLYLKELELIDQVKGEVFNVGGGHENTMSLIECIDYIEKLAKKKAKLTFHNWRTADQIIYISSIEKVFQMTGWKPTISPKEGIKIMLDNV